MQGVLRSLYQSDTPLLPRRHWSCWWCPGPPGRWPGRSRGPPRCLLILPVTERIQRRNRTKTQLGETKNTPIDRPLGLPSHSSFKLNKLGKAKSVWWRLHCSIRAFLLELSRFPTCSLARNSAAGSTSVEAGISNSSSKSLMISSLVVNWYQWVKLPQLPGRVAWSSCYWSNKTSRCTVSSYCLSVDTHIRPGQPVEKQTYSHTLTDGSDSV